jgi:membrane associated rhomboid family serine protease
MGTIEALSHALETPEARLAAHMLRPGATRLTGVLTLIFLVAGALQLAAGTRLSHDPGLLHRLSVGWESTLLDGAWWSAATAPLVHHSFAHLLGNLVLLAYCGWRCERAVGATGLLGIVSGAATGAALGVLLGSERGAVGASGLAFGVWGGQFAIGWRYGGAIPERLRRYYGRGTLWVAVLLLGWSSLSPMVTFAGHLGGFAGGCAAVFLLPVATSVPLNGRQSARRRALLLSAAFSAVIPLLSLAAPHAPSLMLYPASREVDPRSGLGVLLPWRLRATPSGTARALPAAGDAPPLSLAVLALTGTSTPTNEAVLIHERDALAVSWNPATPIAPGRRALYEAIAASARWQPPIGMRAVRVGTAASEEGR